ncbi:hypothetical protein EV586_10148 [Tumebacillus sp. BK434]|uniref:DUF6115 domain-containing protein n=1 Tax=Tumebacillus sp. BK434 TaxID=2512169 RepID=UPI001050BA74|nr:hypothetical protein [Tumebacillus sp. BK434]TCP58849.1 hypothetical protein EV586_10148 [Tumebacillus sp. BK434]
MVNQLYLYVALIGLALVLYALTRTKGTAQAPAPDRPAPAAVDQELKDLLDDFMNELERDNVKLIDGFNKLQIEQKEQIASQNKIIRTLEKRIIELETKLAAAPQPDLMPTQETPAALVSAAPAPAAVAAATVAEETAKPAFVMQEKYAHVLTLSRQGLTPEQIARDTGIGVGEILLVIGLAKRGEA